MKVKIENAGDPRKGKCWQKVVTSVDTTKTNGYAFRGDFIREGEHDLEPGTVILLCSRVGSWKNGYEKGIVQRVEEDGSLLTVGEFNYYREFVSLRDCVAEALAQKINPLERFSDEEILTEAKRRGLL